MSYTDENGKSFELVTDAILCDYSENITLLPDWFGDQAILRVYLRNHDYRVRSMAYLEAERVSNGDDATFLTCHGGDIYVCECCYKSKATDLSEWLKEFSAEIDSIKTFFAEEDRKKAAKPKVNRKKSKRSKRRR